MPVIDEWFLWEAEKASLTYISKLVERDLAREQVILKSIESNLARKERLLHSAQSSYDQQFKITKSVEKSLSDFKNPYDTSRKALTHGGDITNDNDVGYIRMRSPGSKIEVMSCIQTPCSATRCSSDNHICSGDINLN